MGLRLSSEDDVTPLNAGYTSDEDLMILNDWEPYMVGIPWKIQNA
jgi:hypothetical protein